MSKSDQAQFSATPRHVAGNWDRDLTRRAIAALRPLAEVWSRPEVRGGSATFRQAARSSCQTTWADFSQDIPVLAIEFYDRFGNDRPLYLRGTTSCCEDRPASLRPHLPYSRGARERAENAPIRRHGDGLSGRGLRRLPAVDFCQRDRLRESDRVCQDRAGGRGADHAGGVSAATRNCPVTAM